MTGMSVLGFGEVARRWEGTMNGEQEDGSRSTGPPTSVEAENADD
jgi:hypothetical protein